MPGHKRCSRDLKAVYLMVRNTLNSRFRRISRQQNNLDRQLFWESFIDAKKAQNEREGNSFMKRVINVFSW
ncbi:MAG: hypothetical protein WC856_18150 [Methylococcaceae bacterium]|jgi:hypothetical protein